MPVVPSCLPFRNMQRRNACSSVEERRFSAA
jgi:hypothetical protein